MNFKTMSTYVYGLVILSLLVMAAGEFRIGAFLIAADLALVLVWRIRQPLGKVGAYAIRSRSMDVATLSILLVCVGLFALLVPSPR